MAAAAEDSDQVRLEDRPRLVLTEATLLEVARLGSVLPTFGTVLPCRGLLNPPHGDCTCSCCASCVLRGGC